MGIPIFSKLGGKTGFEANQKPSTQESISVSRAPNIQRVATSQGNSYIEVGKKTSLAHLEQRGTRSGSPSALGANKEDLLDSVFKLLS